MAILDANFCHKNSICHSLALHISYLKRFHLSDAQEECSDDAECLVSITTAKMSYESWQSKQATSHLRIY